MAESMQEAYQTLVKPRLNWGGPLILTMLGLVWLLHGYHLLPAFMDVPWLGGILMALGLLRFGMYFLGYY